MAQPARSPEPARPSRGTIARLFATGSVLPNSSSSSSSCSERDAFIALNLLPLHPLTLQRSLHALGGALAALHRWETGAIAASSNLHEDLQEQTGPTSPGRALSDGRTLRDRGRDEEQRALAAGFTILTLADEAYPALLREIPDPPPVLYVWGKLEPDDEVRMAIVGARRATRHGLGAADLLARELACRGIVVVSGLARGIDAAAHRGALGAGARTIAVLGSGLQRIYPPEHRDLAGAIASRGAVISEYPLDVGPLPHMFPRRNRVISGLSAGTIVVEAGASSGALVTARMALDQGRELFVVPGSILGGACAGSNGLLVEGVAHITTGAGEILRELPPPFRLLLGLPASHHDDPPPRPLPFDDRTSPRAEEAAPAQGERAPGRRSEPDIDPAHSGTAEGSPAPLDAAESAVWRLLSFDEPMTIDEVCAAANLTIGAALATVSRLEMRGLATVVPGGGVARVRP